MLINLLDLPREGSICFFMLINLPDLPREGSISFSL